MKKCENCEEKPASVRCLSKMICYTCSRQCSSEGHTHEFIRYDKIIHEVSKESESPVKQTLISRKENMQSLANLRLRTGFTEITTERSMSRYIRRKSSERKFGIIQEPTENWQASEAKINQTSRVIQNISHRISMKTKQVQTQNSKLQTVQTSIQTSTDNTQHIIDKLKRRLEEQKLKNVRITESYKKKLEIIRSHLKPQACQVERLMTENEKLRQRIAELQSRRSDSMVVHDF